MGNNLSRNMATKKSLNILFLADHRSIHDKKWITWISENTNHNCYLISRSVHGEMKETWNKVKFLGNIPDYSVTQPWKNKHGKRFLKGIIDTNRIDLFHVYYLEPNALWTLYVHDIGVLTGFTSRGSDVLIGLNHFLERRDILANLLVRRYRKSLQKGEFIFSTSGAQKERIDRYFLGKNEVEIVRTGVNIEKLVDLRKKGLPKKRQVLFGRNMQPIYNHHFVLDQLGNLPSHVKEEYEFIFVDSDSTNVEYTDFIREKIADLTDLKINFLTSQKGNDYHKLIAESTVNVMTPLSDGAPVSAIETLCLNTNLVLPDLPYDADLFSKALYYEHHSGDDFIDTLMVALNSTTETDNSYLELVDRNTQMQIVASIYDEIGK